MVVPEFAAGAMENWGLVTYRENALLLNEDTAEVQRKQRVAMVICHELAHQWFGNLVTMAWWCDLWLNEGFASWMQYFATDHIFPQWRIWESYIMDRVGMALKLDALRSSHPIQVPIKHAEEVEQVFDAISYAKGSTVVHMVQSVLGIEKFREGLQLYMQRHKYSNTETTDLWQAWTDVSGVDISTLMKSWTLEMGYPYLTVVEEKWEDAQVTLKLEQRWFLADGSGSTSENKWYIPLAIAVDGVASPQCIPGRDICDDRVITRVVPLPQPNAYVKLNTNKKAMLHVSHSEAMIERLQTAIRNKHLSAIDRADLLEDQYALAAAGLTSMDLVAALLPAYSRETDPSVWKALQTVLVGIYRGLETAGCASAAAFSAFAKQALVMPALAVVGWDAVPHEPETTRLMRATVFALLDVFCNKDEAVIIECRRRFALSVAGDDSALSNDIKGSVFRIVLSNGGEKEYEDVLSTFYATNEDSKRMWAISTLGSGSTFALKQRCLDWSLGGDVKKQDSYSAFNGVATSKGGARVAWEYFKTNFARIKKLVGVGSPLLLQAFLAACTGQLSTLEDAADLKEFFEKNELPKSDRKISQAIDRIKSSVRLADIVKSSALSNADYIMQLSTRCG